MTSSPGRITPRRDPSRIAAEVLVRADDRLHRKAEVDEVAVGADVDVLQVVEQRRALVPRHVRRCLSTTLSPLSAETGMNVRSSMSSLAGEGA